MRKFQKIIKDIKEDNEFFNIDYEDIINNFSEDNKEAGTERLSVSLDIQNIAFMDSIRGDYPRNKFINRIISVFRKEFVESVINQSNNDDIRQKQEIDDEYHN